MVISTEICKKHIVAHAAIQASAIKKEFSPALDDVAYQEVLAEKNWKRICKNKISADAATGYGIDPAKGVVVERIFDCRPFDDQLRAYVYDQNGAIVKVMIQGE